jgi:hypothetical protein
MTQQLFERVSTVLKIKFNDGTILTTNLYPNDTVLRMVVEEVCAHQRRRRADVADYWQERGEIHSRQREPG